MKEAPHCRQPGSSLLKVSGNGMEDTLRTRAGHLYTTHSTQFLVRMTPGGRGFILWYLQAAAVTERAIAKSEKAPGKQRRWPTPGGWASVHWQAGGPRRATQILPESPSAPQSSPALGSISFFFSSSFQSVIVVWHHVFVSCFGCHLCEECEPTDCF